MKELVKAFNAEEMAEYLRLHPYTAEVYDYKKVK